MESDSEGEENEEVVLVEVEQRPPFLTPPDRVATGRQVEYMQVCHIRLLVVFYWNYLGFKERQTDLWT